MTDAPRTEDTRNRFDLFVESAHSWVSRWPFFFLCIAIIVVWLASVPLWSDLKSWQAAIHTLTSLLTLLLLALLENAGRRAETASQEKLDLLAEALADLMEAGAGDRPELAQGATRLREAIELDERR